MTAGGDQGATFLDLRLTFDESGENPVIAAALAAEVAERFGPRDEKPFALSAVEQDGALAAGINGVSHWRWLYVRHLFVAPSWRGRGLGRMLLEEAERRAAARGCAGIYLDTFSPEAVAFYERCGFISFGTLEGFPPGHRRAFLQKRLA